MFTRLNLKPVKHPDKMIEYWKKEWKTILIVIISGVLFNGSMSLIPVMQGRLMDTVIYDRTWEIVLYQACIFIALVIIIQLFRGIKRFGVRVFANQTGAVMRKIIYNNILHRAFDELIQETAGDLMNKAVNDVDLCVEGMRKVTTEVFDTGVLMAGYFISMMIYDWRMTLAACALIPAAMLIASRLKVVVVRFNKEARRQSSAVAEITFSHIEHMKLYRINGVMDDKCQEYERELEKLEKSSVKANVLETSMQPIYNAISMIGIGIILYYGGAKVIDGGWSVGTFTAYVAIFTALGIKASKAAKLFNSFQKASVSWKRLKPYFTGYRETNTLDDRTDFNTEPYVISCENVTFKYTDSDKKLLDNVTFSMKTGQITGVTGPVAGGKTTLGKIMTGVFNYDGRINMNGVELSSMTEYQRSKRISYDGHNPQLFSDTIYNNITMGNDGDITSVLLDVCFDVDIKTMENGIETMVGNGGVRLSGGQQARIALARALWHKTPLIVLDDPFSAVDMATERKIIENLHNNYKDSAFLLISHRLAAFSGLDNILYLKDGKVISGTHEHLLKVNSEYEQLNKLQSGEDRSVVINNLKGNKTYAE